MGILGGQPSTTQPIAGPWLSPQVVTRKRWPKVLWDIGAAETLRRAAGQASNSDRQHGARGKQDDAILRRGKVRGIVRREAGEPVQQDAQSAAMGDEQRRRIQRYQPGGEPVG